MLALFLSLVLGQVPSQQGNIVVLTGPVLIQPDSTLPRWPGLISIELQDVAGRWYVVSGANSVSEANASLAVVSANNPWAVAWRYR